MADTAWDRRALLGGLTAAGIAGPAHAGLFGDKKTKPKDAPAAPVEEEADEGAPAFFTKGSLAANKVAADFRVPTEPMIWPTKMHFMGPKDGPHSLEDYRGKTIILSMWAEWCQWCLVEMPVFDRLNELFANDKFEIVTVLTGSRYLDGWRDTRTFLDKRMNCTHLSALVDTDDRLTRALARTKSNPNGALPCNVLIGPDGRPLARCVGASTYELKGRKVSTWASEEGIVFYRALAAGALSTAT